MTRFAVREATLDDAEGIARAHTASWQTSYRGILPDTVLDRIDVGQRAETRRRILRDRSIYQLVAYDITHGDIVGFCDAGPARRHVPYAGELYAIYLVDPLGNAVLAWPRAPDIKALANDLGKLLRASQIG